MIAFLCVMLSVDWLVCGFATLPLSERVGEHPSVSSSLGRWLEIPLPQDWVGFLVQLRHQRSGGPSYLLGERRLSGWWWYYPVALAVKVPLGLLVLQIVRSVFFRDTGRRFLPLIIASFLAIAMLGSSRNYGVRYLLPIFPVAIVWISSLAEGRIGARARPRQGLLPWEKVAEGRMRDLGYSLHRLVVTSDGKIPHPVRFSGPTSPAGRGQKHARTSKTKSPSRRE